MARSQPTAGIRIPLGLATLFRNLGLSVLSFWVLGNTIAQAATCSMGNSVVPMVFSGTLSSSSSGPALSQSQQVLAYDSTTATLLPSNGSCNSANTYGACGSISSVTSSTSATYSISISEPQSFSDKLTLLLYDGTKYYSLLNTATNSYGSAGATMSFNYTYYSLSICDLLAGTADLSSVSAATVTDDLTVGAGLASTPSSSSSSGSSTSTSSSSSGVCPSGLSNCDLNGDSVFDEKDVAFVRHALADYAPSSKADVNGDGVVDSNDVIAIMRALNEWQKARIMGGTGNSATTK